MKRLLILLFVQVLFCQFALAEVLSYHDRQDTALREAKNKCRSAGGSWDDFDWSQTERWALEDHAKGFLVRGSGLLIICKIKTSDPNVFDLLITWQHPTHYENGNDLPLSEIESYRLIHNGTPYSVALTTSFILKGLPKGTHVIEMQTLGKNGLWSAISEKVEKTL